MCVCVSPLKANGSRWLVVWVVRVRELVVWVVRVRELVVWVVRVGGVGRESERVEGRVRANTSL